MQDSEGLSKYYQLANEFVDVYLDKWKISPRKLKLYLGKNEKMVNFLKRNGLENIENIHRVISDVLEDRSSMEMDSVVKFESFMVLESNDINESDIYKIISKGIDKTNISHEKILSDVLDVSLSEINVLEVNSHKFSVEDIEYLVYTKEEIVIIGQNIIDYCINKILQKDISIEISESHPISMKSSSIIDKSKLEREISSQINSDVNGILLSIIKSKFPKSSSIQSSDFVCKL